MKKWAVLLVFIGSTAQADIIADLSAPVVTVAILERMCKNVDALDGAESTPEVVMMASGCAHYIKGFADFGFVQQNMNYPRQMCLPLNASYDQFRRVFLKYVADNPRVLNLQARTVFFGSLVQAFPCDISDPFDDPNYKPK